MTANPPLACIDGATVGPHLFANERLVLRRDFIDLALDGLRTASGTWKSRGSLFLTDLRLTFVAPEQDSLTGLQAFDIPHAYTRREKFNQPVFGCNNLSGEVWSTEDGAGPNGGRPPHCFALYFKSGGVGTFLPHYFQAIADARSSTQGATQNRTAATSTSVDMTRANAFVDPSDPSKVYLTQPKQAEERLPERPRYADNYGADEKYEA